MTSLSIDCCRQSSVALERNGREKKFEKRVQNGFTDSFVERAGNYGLKGIEMREGDLVYKTVKEIIYTETKELNFFTKRLRKAQNLSFH